MKIRYCAYLEMYQKLNKSVTGTYFMVFLVSLSCLMKTVRYSHNVAKLQKVSSSYRFSP